MAAVQGLRSCTRSVMPSVAEITLQCSDGMKLAAQLWRKESTASSSHPQEPSTQIDTSSTTSHSNRILCLHGWMDNARSFHILGPALVQNLAGEETELVAVDLPGHGRSSHKALDGPPAMLSEAAFYVAEAVQQLQWNDDTQPFVLIGHSMGAAISCLYAAAFPEYVQKLVLLEGAGPLARNARDVAKHVRQHVLRRQLGLQQTKESRIYPTLEAAIQQRCNTATNFAGNQWLSEAAARELVLRGSVPVEGGVRFAHDPRLQLPSLQYFTLEQTESLYHDIQCPTALLLAEHGWPFDADKMKRSLEILHPAMFVTLPGSHHMHADPENADLVAENVLKFLQA